MAEEKHDNKSPLRGGDLALQPVISVLVCGAVGYGVDQWLGVAPWGMLVGGILGFVAAMRVLWQAVK